MRGQGVHLIALGLALSTLVAAQDTAPSPDAHGGGTAHTDDLQRDVSQLIDELVQVRARAALLGNTLYKTRLKLRVQNLAAPDPVLVKIVLTLDGAPVFHAASDALANDEARQVFEGAVAPGPHVLVAEVEQRNQRDAAYGYTLHDSYRFQVQRDKQNELTLVLDDDSDVSAGAVSGEYDVRTKLRIRTWDLKD